MIHEASGLDYFLLPSLFSDCLAPGGYESLLRERDDWFTANPKFGRTYVDHMTKMQQSETDLLPNLGIRSDEDECVSENPQIGMGLKLGAGRRAIAVDQVARAGGLSRDFKIDPWSPMSSGGKHLSTLLGEIGIAKPLGADISQSRLVDRGSETDEDEENDMKRKRRRRRSAHLAVKVKLESDSEIGRLTATKDLMVPSEDHAQSFRGRPRVLSRHDVKVRKAEAKTDVDVTDVKLEDVKPSTNRPPPRRPRFSVDKEHLRLLTRLAQEVDDS